MYVLEKEIKTKFETYGKTRPILSICILCADKVNLIHVVEHLRNCLNYWSLFLQSNLSNFGEEKEKRKRKRIENIDVLPEEIKKKFETYGKTRPIISICPLCADKVNLIYVVQHLKSCLIFWTLFYKSNLSDSEEEKKRKERKKKKKKRKFF